MYYPIIWPSIYSAKSTGTPGTAMAATEGHGCARVWVSGGWEGSGEEDGGKAN